MRHQHTHFGYLLLTCIVVVGLSCSQRLRSTSASPTSWTVLPPSGKAVDCRKTNNSIPDTNHLAFWPVKQIRLNYHVMMREGGRGMLDSAGMVRRLRDVVSLANHWLDNKVRPWLPKDNPPPAIDSRWRYVIAGDTEDSEDDGIYIHHDDDIPYHVHSGKGQNRGSSLLYKRYAVGSDTVLNVFIVAHHPDSIKSRRYKSGVAGVAMGSSWVKMVDDWDTNKNTAPNQNNLIHEIGHIYTLQHTWAQNDGCDDTPRHENCWNINEPAGCTVVSNNVMDYNANAIALSPCQIGRVQAVMGQEHSRQRSYLRPNWCHGRAGGEAVLSDSLILNHRVDLEGQLTLLPGAYLEINCRLSIPAGKKIRVHPGATLVLNGTLHNSCGLDWLGIEVLKQGGINGKLVWHEGARLVNVLGNQAPTPIEPKE